MSLPPSNKRRHLSADRILCASVSVLWAASLRLDLHHALDDAGPEEHLVRAKEEERHEGRRDDDRERCGLDGDLHETRVVVRHAIASKTSKRAGPEPPVVCRRVVRSSAGPHCATTQEGKSAHLTPPWRWIFDPLTTNSKPSLTAQRKDDQNEINHRRDEKRREEKRRSRREEKRREEKRREEMR